MFGQVPETPFDLRFSLLGIPVRVHPVFWLSSAFLAWDPSGDGRMIFIRILCIFLAILVHEMGHAVVTKLFGWQPEIVLYFFGGYATSTRHSTWKDIAVSAAGPLAGFALWIAFFVLGVVLTVGGWLDPRSDVGSVVWDAIAFSLFINLVWNAMNLAPVVPLDGGQICRELCTWLSPDKGMERCLIISTITAGGIAAWALLAMFNKSGVLGLDPKFLAFMFGYLAFQSYQQYEQVRRGYW